MQFSIPLLKEYEKNGLLSCRKHPTENLFIWNYTQKVQFENLWDEITMQCRGLIIDGHGNIVVRCFKKFFSLNQTENTKIENLPVEIPTITEKLDGSCILQYYVNGKVYAATRGSFESEQAICATKWLQQRFNQSNFISGYTYIYELVAPWNRIVVHYDVEELRLIAVINNETGEELNHVEESKRIGIGYAKIINKSLNDLIKYLEVMKADEEGFVCKYSNGLRIKLKGKEYLKLHHLVTGFSSKSIWECLMTGQDIESMMYAVPDEFFNWIKKKKAELIKQYESIRIKAELAHTLVHDLPTQKDKAIVILRDYKDISGLVFSLLKGRNIDTDIWEMIEPKFELPFKNID